MTDRQFEWCGIRWTTRERWGTVHPEKAYCWYDDNCVSVDDDGYLRLICKYAPRRIESVGESFYPTYGVGLVSSFASGEVFKYGHYLWEAKLPSGRNLWPALWMWAGPWPPEIDVVEAWTNSRGGYYGFPFTWKVTSNFHQPDAVRNMAKRAGVFCMPDPTKKFIKYELYWDEKKLEFVYNGRLVRKVDDPDLMKYLAESTPHGMDIIMNNHVTEEYHSFKVSEPLIVKRFEYEK